MSRVTKKKTGIMLALIYIIAFAVVNMLVFFIFKEKNALFWVSYAFITLAFIVQVVSMLLSFSSMEVEAAFFGIPLASLSLFYFFAAVFTAAVFMIFQNAPVKLGIALQVIILAVYVIVAIVAVFSKDVVQDVNDTIKVNVTAIQTMQSDVSLLVEITDNAELKNRLRKLGDTIRYSDPMSNDSVTGIENQIMQILDELRILCESGETQDALDTCRQLELLFLQRNKTLRASK